MEGLGKYGGRILSKTDIDEWADFLKKEYGTQLEKVDNFEDVNVIAQFDPNTNTIRYKENARSISLHTNRSMHRKCAK